MADNKMRKIYAGLVLCMSLASLTACGSSDEESTDNSVMGRVTAISDSKMIMEVFEQDQAQRQDGERPNAASGSGAQFDRRDGEMPEGTPPTDGQKPKGTPPADGQKPKGTPPAGKGESKTFQINGDTQIYKQSGEEKTEITIDEIELGSWVSVTIEDDVAKSIIIQDREQFGKRGNRNENETSSHQEAS